MGKLLIAIWIFLGSLFSVSHQSPTQHSVQPTATPTVLPKLMPTPTLAPGQKAIYTFYIQATAHKTSNGEITLNTPDTGKIFTVDIGTLIIVNFRRAGKFHVSVSSPQAIFTNSGRPETIHLPENASGAFRPYRSGFGTITVDETY